MNKHGFTSAVQLEAYPNHLMVRARDRASLLDVTKCLGLPESEIYTKFPSDYAYRIVITKEQYSAYLLEQVEHIDYPNFKNAAQEQRGTLYHDALANVWHDMRVLTPAAVERKNDQAWIDAMPETSDGNLR